jgi:TRAP-type transport system periplasmic protein
VKRSKDPAREISSTNLNRRKQMKRPIFVLANLGFLAVLFTLGSFAYAKDMKPIELKFSHWIPTTHGIAKEVYEPWVKEVEEKTNGRVKVRIYPAEALGKAKDHADMVVTGVADMGVFMPIYTPGRFPMTSFLELPLIVPNAKATSLLFYDLVQNYFSKEYKGFKYLFGGTTDNYHFLMAKKPAKSLDDLKGLKIRAAGAQHVVFIRALGGAPVALAAPEMYEGLQRVIIDANFNTLSTLRDFKLSEVIKYVTYAGTKGTESIVGINQRTWDSLPKDIQDILEGLTKKYSEMYGLVFDKYAAIAVELSKKAGIEFYEFSAEDKKKLLAYIQPQTNAKVAEMEAAGLPGKNIYESTVKFLESYSD